MENFKTSAKVQNLKKRIGENIRKIRQNSNVEVKTLCNDLEISQSAYSNIERGETDVSISRIMQLAEYFGVHYAQILAVDNTTIFQMSPRSSDSSTQTNHNQQIATMNSDGSEIAIKQLQEENTYLREQNKALLEKVLGQ